MNIENRLKEYREKTARIKVLELEIEGLMDELHNADGITETDAETIEGMTFRRTEGGGGSSEFSSKTERIALKYKDEQGKIKVPQEVSFLTEEIRKRQIELKRLREETEPISIAINGLTGQEKLVIEEFYINNSTWYTVSMVHQQRYGQYIVKETCQKIRNRALKKMKRILLGEQN